MEASASALHSNERHDAVYSDSRSSASRLTKWRILSSFWIFGLGNNFGFTVMLVAAYDIIGRGRHNDTNIDGCLIDKYSKPPYELLCLPVGTGAILLADVLPCLMIKITGPFFMGKISYNLRVTACLLCRSCSFLVAGLAGLYNVNWLSIVGVSMASFDCGLGEIVFLGYTSHFKKSTLSAWSCGTGASGLAAGLIYAGLTQAGISPPTTLFLMLFCPFLQALCFYLWLVKPNSVKGWLSHYHEGNSEEKQPILASNMPTTVTDESKVLIDNHKECDATHDRMQLSDSLSVAKSVKLKADFTFLEKLKLISPLLKYIIPLFLVYLAEYYINQSLVELLYFPASCSILSISEQYRWLNTTYQLGVFLSRSSIICFRWTHIWIIPILQFGNVVLLQSEVLLHYMPNYVGLWMMFFVILWEGLLGGLVYVNAFHQISTEVTEEHREFSMGVGSIGDALGTTSAAFLSILVHNKICKMDITWS